MKIKFETDNFEETFNPLREFITPCKYMKGQNVGAPFCTNLCNYNKETNFDEYYVECTKMKELILDEIEKL